MLRKLLLVLLVFGLVVGGLQLFGGRDFSQLGLAFEKHQKGTEFGVLVSDILTIFQGGRVKEPNFLTGKYANQVMYRWKDELGQIHVSERQPDGFDFETINMGDLKFDVQAGLSREEIEKILKTKFIVIKPGMSIEEQRQVVKEAMQSMSKEELDALKRKLQSQR